MDLPPIPTVRIDDLAEPTWSPAVQHLRAQMTALAPLIPWDVDGLCSVATMETGLDTFGDNGFRDRLATVLRCWDETPLSPAGRVALWGQMLQYLKNRLLVEHELRRHPEIHDIEVRAPIVIVGLPRTGTTHLHNLIAADPGLRFLPYWESVEPVLCDAQRTGGAVDPRWERTETALQALNETLPYFKRMHHMTTWHAHEEINLLAIDFSSMLFETLALSTSLRDWYKAHDQTAHYEYLKTVMKVLQFLRPGPVRWVLKSPQNLEQLAVLNRVFPDATVVFTHRDPVSVTASMVTMQAYLLRLSYDHVDPERVGRYWSDRVEDLLMACLRDRDLVPPERSLDVRFDDYMADQLAMLERIYALADQPITEAARRGWQTYLNDHGRDRHGKVVYELAPFGIDAAERRATYGPYLERFDLRAEQ
ncbi:sulfotransferase family protein [Mycobacterium heckeshornense]|uniref:sulfotransferase family protein n=1 Tax=Mycobacterium heckeshornense TaxID=110505 RepID=UPI001941C2EB|nr:sulfotransferase [Mycobacterium heckeshornense]BCQ07836.1 sulfotransferase family protein [Mycobacterium heckeshornense]